MKKTEWLLVGVILVMTIFSVVEYYQFLALKVAVDKLTYFVGYW